MSRTPKSEYLAAREQTVTKANDLIQKSRFALSTQEQKLILYLISKIEPSDTELHEYELSIFDFCKVCGIEPGGNAYKQIKDKIKHLADKSIWITQGDTEILLRWIEKAKLNPKSGFINLRLDDDMKPYLIQLKEQFTQYELIYTLQFHSKYSIRLYELVQSIHYNELKPYSRAFSVDELRQLLGAETYTQYKEFRRRVLAPALAEINENSDKTVTAVPLYQGKTIKAIELTITSKSVADRIALRARIEQDMTRGQLDMFQGVNDDD